MVANPLSIVSVRFHIQTIRDLKAGDGKRQGGIEQMYRIDIPRIAAPNRCTENMRAKC